MAQKLCDFLNKYPVTLNEQQKAAVESVDGAVLLLAVPGSGKTTVLVARLGYMVLSCGIDPDSVLTMTYTVAATRDMKARYASVFGTEAASRVEFRTINGVAQRVLNLFGQKTGRTAFRLLSDEKERSGILREAYKDVKKDFPTESDIRELSTAVTYVKNMLLPVKKEEELKKHGSFEFPDDFSAIYVRYQEILRQEKKMDYDDQLTAAYKILCSYPEILSEFQSRYRYICVDEAQDTSKVQHRIIELLAKGSGNIFMVGDEDQSIYGFRAAYPEALLSFEKTYPGAKVLFMEENFRSDANIVAAADSFIRKNTSRREKHMTAFREKKRAIREIHLSAKRQQYTYLLKAAASEGPETAVLFRDNECAIPLIDLFERNGIPYRMRQGDAAFFSHRVVQDIENIIRFAYDPADTELFLSVYYKLNLYLTKQLAEETVKRARKSGSDVLDVLIGSKDAGIYVIKNAKALRTHLQKIREMKAGSAVYSIVNFMGYGEYLERSRLSDAKVDILLSVAAGEDTAMGLIRRLSELKAVMSGEMSDISKKPPENTSENTSEKPPEKISGKGITLSTIHSSKGLEYDRVYLIDVINGCFPEEYLKDIKTGSPDEVRTFEEERRLFYVGMTRAKNELCIFTYDDAPSGFAGEVFGKNTGRQKKTTKSKTAADISAASMKAFAKK